MGLFIIFSVLVVVGIILIIIDNIPCVDELCGVIGKFFIIIFLTALFLTLICFVIICSEKDKNFEQALFERQIIEYRLKNYENDIVGNELLYKDIVDFNAKLRTHKAYSNNFWIGIFFNEKIATIEYVDFIKDEVEE